MSKHNNDKERLTIFNDIDNYLYSSNRCSTRKQSNSIYSVIKFSAKYVLLLKLLGLVMVWFLIATSYENN